MCLWRIFRGRVGRRWHQSGLRKMRRKNQGCRCFWGVSLRHIQYISRNVAQENSLELKISGESRLK